MKRDLVFDKIFNEYYGKNKLLFEKYKLIYNLPTVVSECNVSKKLFDYCLRKKYFVLLLIYDDEGKVYFDRNMSDILCWGLPGGSIKDNETINQAVKRIAKNINKDIIIGDVEAVTLIENKFRYGNQEFIHYGMGFIARIRNKEIINANKLTGNFIEVTDEEISYINRLASKKVVEIYKKRYKEIINKTNNCFQEQEIYINEKYKRRYEIHKKIMKKYILTEKRKKKKEYQQIMKQMIGNSKSIIDVSCGEDNFIFDLGKELGLNLVVGNDISWSQIEMLDDKYDDVIFTNHNAASLPFKEKIFDIAYCSNTLHHMPNKKSLVNMLENMSKVATKIIITEIENPEITGGFPKWLNKNWYIGYLKDVGGAYLSESQFKIIINDTFKSHFKIEYKTFKNIMGTYLIAEITRKGGRKNGKKD